MSATNQTAVYGLPIFLGTDVPSWLTDWNGAMGDIDTAIAAAKAAADAAASTAGTAATDIVTINGQITSLQNTVGTHTTQIGTISGSINTINSLIGNGTPTTTDQTIIGAINELHANQGDLANLTTTDKTSLVAAINEAAQGSGAAASGVSYDNTGSGLTATDVQDAIDELAASATGVNYSTTEKAIGKWVDNSTLYETTVSFGALPNNTTKDVNHSIANIDKIVYAYMFGFDTNTGMMTPVPAASTSSTTAQISLTVDRTKVSVKSAYDQSNFDEAYVTIRYTKQ